MSKKYCWSWLMFNRKTGERKEVGTGQENAWLSSTHYLIRTIALQCLKHELGSHLVHNLTEVWQGRTRGSSQSGWVVIIKITLTKHLFFNNSNSLFLEKAVVLMPSKVYHLLFSKNKWLQYISCIFATFQFSVPCFLPHSQSYAPAPTLKSENTEG